MYKCKYCNKEFELRQLLAGHTTHCNKNPKYEINKEHCSSGIKNISKRTRELITNTCKFCGKEITSTKSGITFHENRCIENPNRILHPGNRGNTKGHKAWNKGLSAANDERILKSVQKRKENYIDGKWTMNWHRWSEEEKENLSLKRKLYLKEHPNEHVWKRHDKFISKPCEYLKEQFRMHNICFIEEYTPLENYNYSIDIAWPNLKIGLEVNGNLHYNNNGLLNDYYQNRHNILKKHGWKIYEIHYTKCYSLDINEIINGNNLNTLDEEYVRLYFLKKQEKKNNKDLIKQQHIKNKQKYYQENKEILVNLEQKSGIDFSKHGWVELAKKYIENINKNFPTKMLRRSILKYYPEFFENNKVFIRKI